METCKHPDHYLIRQPAGVVYITGGDVVDRMELVCTRCDETVVRPDRCVYDCLQGWSYCADGHTLWIELSEAQLDARVTNEYGAIRIHKFAVERYQAHLRECSVSNII
jgi:hypothetical protein